MLMVLITEKHLLASYKLGENSIFVFLTLKLESSQIRNLLAKIHKRVST